ncbi:MAG: hypothetical protein QM764_09180 [Chitinophagaceae bacterium]
MKLILPTLILFALAIISCRSNRVLVSFKNVSDKDFKELKVFIDSQIYTFNDLKKNHSTKFVQARYTYPYCPARVITDNDTLDYFFIDFAGERVYIRGKVRMEFSIENKRILKIVTKRLLF